MKYQRIFLIGFMGAGKSTYGRQLAEELGWAFSDTDNWIESETGKSVPEIFERDGQPAFREWEAKALDAAIQQTNVVVATGGGLPVNPDHQERMRTKGLVIWLNTNWETLLKRLSAMKGRPLVDQSKPNWREELSELYKSRLPAYRCAHLIIDPNQWEAKRMSNWLMA